MAKEPQGVAASRDVVKVDGGRSPARRWFGDRGVFPSFDLPSARQHVLTTTSSLCAALQRLRRKI